MRVVHEGDRSPSAMPSPGPARSRAEGFPFHFEQARERGGGDHQLYQEMWGWLDSNHREGRTAPIWQESGIE